MLKWKLLEVVVLVDKDRVKSAQYAIKKFGCDTLILDDGFQYLRLRHRLDIVLVDRDCHKSHHYGMVLAGAEVVYLDSYPLNEYSMYGAVPLREIKHQLLALKAAGKLDRVRMLLLTNCTFDGLVYNVERVMEECLAIKSDLVFLWDEAWFAFARFSPTYRQRTGMRTANNLRKRLKSDAHKAAYAAQQRGEDTVVLTSFGDGGTSTLADPSVVDDLIANRGK